MPPETWHEMYVKPWHQELARVKTVWANAAKMPPETWYEMYVKPWHQELARVRMHILSQVISLSSCERNWSAHRHIHTKVPNWLDPATTEKFVYVYSNSKLVASTSYADLTSSRCLLGTMKMFRFCTACLLDWARPKRQGAEAPSRSFRREARGARREARVAAQHLGTPWPTLPGGAGGGRPV